MSDNFKILENETEFNNIIENNQIVIVDFFAEWCGPCQMFSKILEDYAKENADVFCLKVNVDDFNSISNKYNIVSLPTILIFKNKELKNTNVGLIPKSKLEEVISKL